MAGSGPPADDWSPSGSPVFGLGIPGPRRVECPICTRTRELTTIRRTRNLQVAAIERPLRGDSIPDPIATGSPPMTTTVVSGEQAVSEPLLSRASQIAQAEMARLLARTPQSARLFERATRILPFGVVSSFQKMQPYPIYVT